VSALGIALAAVAALALLILLGLVAGLLFAPRPDDGADEV
jgi:hypothetical protein